MVRWNIWIGLLFSPSLPLSYLSLVSLLEQSRAKAGSSTCRRPILLLFPCRRSRSQQQHSPPSCASVAPASTPSLHRRTPCAVVFFLNLLPSNSPPPEKLATAAAPFSNSSRNRDHLALTHHFDPLARPLSISIARNHRSYHGGSTWQPSSGPPWSACHEAPLDLPLVVLDSPTHPHAHRLLIFFPIAQDARERVVATRVRRRLQLRCWSTRSAPSSSLLGRA